MDSLEALLTFSQTPDFNNLKPRKNPFTVQKRALPWDKLTYGMPDPVYEGQALKQKYGDALPESLYTVLDLNSMGLTKKEIKNKIKSIRKNM